MPSLTQSMAAPTVCFRSSPQAASCPERLCTFGFPSNCCLFSGRVPRVPPRPPWPPWSARFQRGQRSPGKARERRHRREKGEEKRGGSRFHRNIMRGLGDPSTCLALVKGADAGGGGHWPLCCGLGPECSATPCATLCSDMLGGGRGDREVPVGNQ